MPRKNNPNFTYIRVSKEVHKWLRIVADDLGRRDEDRNYYSMDRAIRALFKEAMKQ